MPRTTSTDLEAMLRRTSERVRRVLAEPETYRMQLLISEVVVDRSNRPVLRRAGYRVDAEYFYPASSIKLGAAVVALQTLESLARTHATGDLLEVPCEIAPLFPGDPAQSTEPDERPITIGRELRKLALVSDNQAFNRLYDLVGHEALNRGLHGLGLSSVVINHRLSDPRPIPDPLATAAVVLRPPGGKPIEIPARTSALVLTNTTPRRQVGDAYLKGDVRVEGAMDFTTRNGISLQHLQDLLVKLARPDIDLGTPPLELTANHRAQLLLALTAYPRESKDPVYPVARYPDDYSKFLLPGVRRVFPNDRPGERIEITGKIGRAYGFSVENAYLWNRTSGRAVFVTVALYTNSDGVLNDDRYDYAEIADPILADLGELVARRWLAGP